MRGRRALALVVLGALLVAGLVAVPRGDDVDAALPAGFTSTAVMTGLTLPTAVAFSPDGKVYVSEKSGVIRVYPNASSNSGTIFKDLSPKVFDGWDRGLLGLTVDPRLGNGTNHDFVYALYSTDAPPGVNPPYWNDRCSTPPGPHTDGCIIGGTLSRIPVNANGTAGTEQIIIDNEWCQQFTSHSVGHIEFGPDGIPLRHRRRGRELRQRGLGPVRRQPRRTPRRRRTPAATRPAESAARKARRPHAAVRCGPRACGDRRARRASSTARSCASTPTPVPASPATRSTTRRRRRRTRPRIIAYGLRNSFRFTNRPGTSEIWTGDVGWGDWEEINRIQTPTPARR